MEPAPPPRQVAKATINSQNTATYPFNVDFRDPPPKVTINNTNTVTYRMTVDYRPLLREIQRDKRIRKGKPRPSDIFKDANDREELARLIEARWGRALTKAEKAERDQQTWFNWLDYGPPELPPVELEGRHGYRGKAIDLPRPKPSFWARAWSWLRGRP